MAQYLRAIPGRGRPSGTPRSQGSSRAGRCCGIDGGPRSWRRPRRGAPPQHPAGSPVKGKVVAVTGASSGIGEATALELAARGAAVVLGARRTDRLDALADHIRASGGRAEVLATDVTQRADLEQLVTAAVERFGRLDVLVSNAGIARTGLMVDLDVDAWEAMINVNVRGVLHGIAAALPVFRRQGHGHLVTTVSTSGLKIVPTQAVYAGTKNGVRTLLEALRQESTDGVLRTTSISPGFVRTELVDYIDDPDIRAQLKVRMAAGISLDATGRACPARRRSWRNQGCAQGAERGWSVR